MQLKIRAFAALAALIGCTVALPVIAQDNPNAGTQTTNRRQRNPRPSRTQSTDNATTTTSMTTTDTMAMQPVAPDFQRNIDKAVQTLDNIVKLLDAIEARKAGARPAGGTQ